MKKKTTIYDIAEALNITVSTVSRALSGFPAISDATRKAVIAKAKQLNYSPNKLASALKSGKTNIIGVIVPSVQTYFFATIIHCIEEVLKAHGYRVIIYQSNELLQDEINGVTTLLEAQVDGLMASISLETKTAAHFKEVVMQNKPLILFDRIIEELNVPTVTLDDFKAGYQATEHLIKQGYRSIAMITTIHGIKLFDDRLKGYQAALKDYQLPIVSEHMVFGGLSIEDGRIGADTLMQLGNRPDACLAGDDFTALGASQRLKELGYAAPAVGVIGFSNESFSAYVTPQLSTVDQHPNQIGEACAQLFLKMVSQKNPYQEISKVVIEPTIVERQSTVK
ncbi:LacI family DNA-binding transcriptional regulator [Pedobacter sp. BMA]|uniref:LacI family DNA-binding transcriptional regulator n=1 Tax=Pedobacter sp. BMA TaxID=1663685 RepID=UPI000649FF73|nr:LacI family DNA-binding transcriptional regulator [Pedobacter sp. BMA]KLT64513.1 LacI family transcriptional regulator [Pedobacter sp. BMA]